MSSFVFACLLVMQLSKQLIIYMHLFAFKQIWKKMSIGVLSCHEILREWIPSNSQLSIWMCLVSVVGCQMCSLTHREICTTEEDEVEVTSYSFFETDFILWFLQLCKTFMFALCTLYKKKFNEHVSPFGIVNKFLQTLWTSGLYI